MNNNVLYFIGGAVVGAIVGVFATKTVYEKKYHKMAVEEIDAVREYYHSKYDSDDVDQNVDANSDDEQSAEITAKSQSYTEARREEFVQYNNIIKGNYLEKEEEEEGAEYERIWTGPESFIIDEMDYGRCGYSTFPLILYADGYLAYDGGSVIDYVNAIDDTIGDNAQNYFGEQCCSPDMVYIRNPKLRSDFMVIRTDECYMPTDLDEWDEWNDDDSDGSEDSQGNNNRDLPPHKMIYD